MKTNYNLQLAVAVAALIALAVVAVLAALLLPYVPPLLAARLALVGGAGLLAASVVLPALYVHHRRHVSSDRELLILAVGVLLVQLGVLRPWLVSAAGWLGYRVLPGWMPGPPPLGAGAGALALLGVVLLATAAGVLCVGVVRAVRRRR